MDRAACKKLWDMFDYVLLLNRLDVYVGNTANVCGGYRTLGANVS